MTDVFTVEFLFFIAVCGIAVGMFFGIAVLIIWSVYDIFKSFLKGR